MNLKPLVNNPQLYKDFLEYLQKELDQVHKELEAYADPTSYLRMQGEARRIRKLMQLRERVNDGREG